MSARAEAPLLLRVRVKPNARRSTLTEPAAEGEPWLAEVKAPPVDGKANRELIALVARHFRTRKSAVSIRHGTGGRTKLVVIERH
jgi:uncharacterized protein (TIGR00251 family)